MTASCSVLFDRGVDRPDRFRLILFRHSHQEIELTRSLIHCADGDSCRCQCLQDPHIRIRNLRTLLSDDRDHREIFLQSQIIRIQLFPNLLKQAFFALYKIIAPDDQSDGIDPGKALFKGQLPVPQDIQHNGRKAGPVA